MVVHLIRAFLNDLSMALTLSMLVTFLAISAVIYITLGNALIEGFLCRYKKFVK